MNVTLEKRAENRTLSLLCVTSLVNLANRSLVFLGIARGGTAICNDVLTYFFVKLVRPHLHRHGPQGALEGISESNDLLYL